MRIINDAFSLLFPAACIICRKKIKEGKLCLRCFPSVKEIKHFCLICQTPLFNKESVCLSCRLFPPVFNHMRFIWDYHRENVPEFINCIKYRPSLLLCKTAGELAAMHLGKLFIERNWDLIIPVPGSVQSRRERLFNQCAVLAGQIVKNCAFIQHSKLCLTALRHKGYKDVQVSLSHAERIKNVQKSFEAKTALVKGKKILLVEDVVTTGATTNYATLALLKAGAVHIDIYALARSEVWNSHRNRFTGLRKKQELQALH